MTQDLFRTDFSRSDKVHLSRILQKLQVQTIRSLFFPNQIHLFDISVYIFELILLFEKLLNSGDSVSYNNKSIINKYKLCLERFQKRICKFSHEGNKRGVSTLQK